MENEQSPLHFDTRISCQGVQQRTLLTLNLPPSPSHSTSDFNCFIFKANLKCRCSVFSNNQQGTLLLYDCGLVTQTVIRIFLDSFTTGLYFYALFATS